MDISPKITAGAPLIQSYGPAGFRIGNKDYPTSVMIVKEVVSALTSDAIDEAALAPILEERPEVLLIGTGAKHEMLDPKLRQTLRAQGVVADSMDTGAASRTFNILLAEGRRVAAILLKIPS